MSLKPRILDLYIMKKFLSTFFMMILLIIGIVIIFDISEKIDDFVTGHASFKEVALDYYVNFVPYFMNMFMSLFVFIAVIFFTSKLTQNSEVVAMLACGVNFHRLMLPYLASAAIICAMSLGLALFVIPSSNAARHEFEAKYFKKKKTGNQNRNIHYQISPGQFVYVESFSRWNNTASKFTLETIKDNELVSKLSAETAAYDTLSKTWTMKKYFVREFVPGSIEDKVRAGSRLDTVINVTIDDFFRKQKTEQDLTYSELRAMIRTQRMRGDPYVKYSLIESYQRWSLPFSAFILTIMGVALSTKKKRGGIGWNLAVGIGLSFAYILFMKFSQMFVYTDSLPTALAIWLPNIVFLLITVVLYIIAPK